MCQGILKPICYLASFLIPYFKKTVQRKTRNQTHTALSYANLQLMLYHMRQKLLLWSFAPLHIPA
jgi:hypothetical protein